MIFGISEFLFFVAVFKTSCLSFREIIELDSIVEKFISGNFHSDEKNEFKAHIFNIVVKRPQDVKKELLINKEKQFYSCLTNPELFAENIQNTQGFKRFFACKFDLCFC